VKSQVPTGDDQTLLASKSQDASSHPGVAAGSVRRCSVCGGEYPADFVVCPRDATTLESNGENEDAFIGVVLGGTYKVIDLLASGGMGLLYEATHLRLGRRFAVKVIHEVYAQIPDIVARFDREARAMSGIASVHVVDVVDVVRAPDGRPCIVFEKLEGEDLEDRLERTKRLPLKEAIDVARQVCRGLAAAHALDIIHRDLKPSNLFLVPSENGVTVKILDFGVAKLRETANLTATGAVVGTPAYMAPEQARSSAGADARADVYGVGAVIYRMLTGRPPYMEEDATSTLASVLEREPTRLTTIVRTIPMGMEALVQRAMARDPAARPQTIQDLDAELAAFEATLAEDSSGAASSTAHRVVTAMTRRAKWVRPVTAALALPAALATGIGVSGFVAALVVLLRDAPLLTSAEVALVAVGGGAAAIATLVAYVRALARAWRTLPALQALQARAGGALLVGVATLGTLELAARAWGVAVALPAESTPLGIAARLFAALVAAATVLFLVRRGATRSR